MVFQESLKGVSRKFQGCFKEVLRVLTESEVKRCFKGVSRKFQGGSKNFLGCFKKVSRIFQEFQGPFKKISRVFPGRLRGVLRDL